MIRQFIRYWLGGYPTAVYLFLLSDFFFGMAQGMVNLMLNLHLLALGFSAEPIGRLHSIGALVMAALAIPAGLAADRFGRRFFYVIGSYGFALPVLILPWVHSYTGIVALFSLYFFSFTLMFTTEFPILSEEVPPRRRTRLFSLVFINFFVWNSLGTLLGGQLPEWLPSGSTRYHWALVTAGVLGLGAGLVRQFMPLTGAYRDAGSGEGDEAAGGKSGDDAGETTPPSPVSLRPLWATLILMGIVRGFTGAAVSLGMNFGNVIFKERFHLPDPAIGRFMTLVGVIGVLGNLLVPRLSDRLGPERSIILITALAVPLYLLTGYSPGLGLYLLGFYLVTALLTMTRPLTSSFSMSAVPARRRSAMSSFQMVGFNGGLAITSWVYGTLMARGDYRTPFVVAAVLVAGAAAVFAAAFGRPRPPRRGRTSPAAAPETAGTPTTGRGSAPASGTSR